MSRWADHLRELKRLFRNVPALQDSRGRAWVISQLRMLGYEVDPGRPDQDAEALLALFNWCVQRHGMIGALTNVLEEIELESEPFRAARDYADQVLPSDHFTLRERDDLLDLVDDRLRPEELNRHLVQALDDLPESPPATSEELLRAVETLPLPSHHNPDLLRMHPVLELLEGLAGDAAFTGHRRELRELSVRVAIRIGRHQRDILEERRRRSKSKPKRQGPGDAPLIGPSLIIKLAPEGLRPDAYRVTAWFCRQAGEQLSATRIETDFPVAEPIGLAKVRAGLPALLKTAAALAIGSQELRIALEFILPRELLNEPVHEWLADPEDDQSFLGEGYLVIIRDLLRQQTSTIGLAWREKWEWLKRAEQVPGCPAAWVDCEGMPEQGELRLQLRKTGTISLGLTERPRLQPGDSRLGMALNLGVPVAIWRRVECDGHRSTAVTGTCPGKQFRTELRQKLAEAELGSLPELVYKLRQEALLRDKAWRHVSLLWDDPTRIPDQLQLNAPK